MSIKKWVLGKNSRFKPVSHSHLNQSLGRWSLWICTWASSGSGFGARRCLRTPGWVLKLFCCSPPALPSPSWPPDGQRSPHPVDAASSPPPCSQSTHFADHRGKNGFAVHIHASQNWNRRGLWQSKHLPFFPPQGMLYKATMTWMVVLRECWKGFTVICFKFNNTHTALSQNCFFYLSLVC